MCFLGIWVHCLIQIIALEAGRGWVTVPRIPLWLMLQWLWPTSWQRFPLAKPYTEQKENKDYLYMFYMYPPCINDCVMDHLFSDCWWISCFIPFYRSQSCSIWLHKLQRKGSSQDPAKTTRMVCSHYETIMFFIAFS